MEGLFSSQPSARPLKYVSLVRGARWPSDPPGFVPARRDGARKQDCSTPDGSLSLSRAPS